MPFIAICDKPLLDPALMTSIAISDSGHSGRVRDRLLLEEDVPAYVKKAQDAPVGK